MSRVGELIWQLTQGVDARNPAIAGREPRFFKLENVEPRLGRLVTTKNNFALQTMGSEITNFGSYRTSAALGDNLYALTSTSVYWINPNDLESLTLVYSGFPSNSGEIVALPWHDCLYVAKIYGPLVRLERKTATVVEGGCWGRYGVVANGHLYFGYAGDSTSHSATRIRWSDLDAPEDYTIDPAVSESDFFDLDPDVRQITGVSLQRDRPVVYTEDSIWVAQYIGFPGGFRHEPLISGVGNIFHYGVVRNKEVDFFIGKDNFYALNGLQVVPIGDEIFERFINDVNIRGVATVRGYIDTLRSQAFWVYQSKSRSNALWTVVYNYREQKWSERSAIGLTAFYDAPRMGLYPYTPIDEVTSTIDSVTALPDADVSPVLVDQLCGYSTPGYFFLGKFGTTYSTSLGSLPVVIESCDMHFDSLSEIKEASRVVLEYTKTGSPTITLEIGVRKNQAEDITWTSVAMDNLDSLNAFYTKAQGIGRYLRFRITFTNSFFHNVPELLLFGLDKVEAGQQNVSASK